MWLIKKTVKRVLGKSTRSILANIDFAPEELSEVEEAHTAVSAANAVLGPEGVQAVEPALPPLKVAEAGVQPVSTILKGWAFCVDAPVFIEVCIDDHRVAVVECDSVRPDVYRVHPDAAASFCSGFSIHFPLSVLEFIGAGRIEVYAATLEERLLLWSWSGGSAVGVEEEPKIDQLKRSLRKQYASTSQHERRGILKRSAPLKVLLAASGSIPQLRSACEQLRILSQQQKIAGVTVLVSSDTLVEKVQRVVQQSKLKNVRVCTAGTFGRIDTRVNYFYLNEDVCLDSLDFAAFLKEFITNEHVPVLSPLLLGGMLGAPVPPVVALKSFSAELSKRARGTFLVPNRSLAGAWITSGAFLAELQGEDEQVSNFCAPPETGFTYYIALAHVVYSQVAKSAQLPVAQRDGIEKLYTILDLPASLETLVGSEVVYFVLGAEPYFQQTMRGAGFMAHALLNAARASGKKVVLLADTEEPYAQRVHLGAFACFTLSDVARQIERGALPKGEIIALSWTAVPCAYTLKYLLQAEAVSYMSSANFDQAIELLDYDWRQKAQWVVASDTPRISVFAPTQKSPQEQDVVGVQVPALLNAVALYEAPEGREKRIAVFLSANGKVCGQSAVQELVTKLESDFPQYEVTIALDETVSDLEIEGRVTVERLDHPAVVISLLARCEAFIDLRGMVNVNFLEYEAAQSGVHFVKPSDGGRDYSANEVAQALKGTFASGQVRAIGPKYDAVKVFKRLSKGLAHAHSKLEEQLRSTRSKVQPLSIIIPIYNALDAVRMCVESLLRSEGEQHEIILVNDASDRVTTEWLRCLAKQHPSFTLLEHPENKGFVQACLSGLAVAQEENDILLLNSDLVLTKDFVSRMQKAAYSGSRVGLVSCLSTGSNHLQIDLNPGDSLEEAAAFLAEKYRPKYPSVITPEGQCLLIRRHALQRFGFFDVVFGKGYCEESDMSMRMFCHGIDMLVADNALVSHRRAASFGASTRQQLYKKNRAVFDARWGRFYQPAYAKFIFDNAIAEVQHFYKASAVPLVSVPSDFALEALLTQFEAVTKGVQRALPVSAVLRDAEVVFVLPKVLVGGGSYSVLQHVNELLARGVNAKVIGLTATKQENFDFPLQTGVISVSAEQFFALDWSKQHVVATFWLTAYYVKELERRFPEVQGYYYIQDYEPWFYSKPDNFPIVEEAAKTYELGLKAVAKTPFLVDTVREQHGIDATLITPGLSRFVFYPGQQDCFFGRPRLAALFRSRTARRGSKEMLCIIERLIERVPEIEVSFFGDTEGLPDSLQGRVNLLGRLTQDQVARLYRHSDIVLDMSYWHGFGRMGIEGMASGAVPALTMAGGVTQYASDEENAVLFPVGDVDTALKKIIRLAKDRKYRLQLRQNGLATFVKNSERKAIDDWLSIFGITPPDTASPIVSVGEPGALRLVAPQPEKRAATATG